MSEPPKPLTPEQRIKEREVQLNEERPHLSLECKTPDAVHRASLASQQRLASSPE
jgi:hypothetical protein